jgi:hypothetical protein
LRRLFTKWEDPECLPLVILVPRLEITSHCSALERIRAIFLKP